MLFRSRKVTHFSRANGRGKKTVDTKPVCAYYALTLDAPGGERTDTMFHVWMGRARKALAVAREAHGAYGIRTKRGHRSRWIGANTPEALGAIETARAYRQLAHFTRRLEAW